MVDLFNLDDRFMASVVLGYPDYDAQIRAMREVLRLHRCAENDLNAEILEIEEFAVRVKGQAAERAVEDLIDHYHHSVFQDAAHSMAAVGMLAPFLESLFKQAFSGIRELLGKGDKPLMGHTRNGMASSRKWNCSYATNGRGLVAGIIELSEAVGLGQHLPPTIQMTLSALFAYRNEMFHSGFEWSLEARVKFADRMKNEEWPDEWFRMAESDDKPWIFYLTEEFVDHCFQMIDQIFDALGVYVRQVG